MGHTGRKPGAPLYTRTRLSLSRREISAGYRRPYRLHRMIGVPLPLVIIGEERPVPFPRHLALCTGAYTRPFSAQRERFRWDRGCIEGLFRGLSCGCLGGVGGCWGVLGGCKGCISCQMRIRLS